MVDSSARSPSDSSVGDYKTNNTSPNPKNTSIEYEIHLIITATQYNVIATLGPEERPVIDISQSI